MSALFVRLHYWQVMRKIVIPQVLKKVILPMVGLSIGLFQDRTLITIAFLQWKM
ncbi:hypothetical protein PZN02_001606 [Sinorhizobium garamanticum]|uniref:Uncharacterized protein n=1 Tax=Sinorhizobium garamanticum TaxID=680247 RepID=A0ABY8DDV8_9HYPH|nr:hypothetical protein [Sinorhizobium garamanticum]WEX89064.1 hypothetical protein PZN02_001606 [Sinorhizobium garamanticum]